MRAPVILKVNVTGTTETDAPLTSTFIISDILTRPVVLQVCMYMITYDFILIIITFSRQYW